MKAVTTGLCGAVGNWNIVFMLIVLYACMFCVYGIVKVFREEKKQLCDAKLKICLHSKFIFICFVLLMLYKICLMLWLFVYFLSRNCEDKLGC